ncbi:DUF6659 family protein [Candidatus Nitrosotalea sp. TS]|uniref:DUF6659 family protein n=1 Tax=Candidatus Nitrosotalea sp. TS TaxID=2341020 RepID=UPI00140E259F|nr:DUF6659 family protein [Candidatus Nitrosotalea sp. TS]
MDYEKICKKVMDLDPKIRFAGIINEKGRLFAGGMREGFKSLEDSRDDEMLYMELVLRAKMRREFDKVLGPVQFAMSYREKVIIMSFPVKENVLLLSTEKGIDFSEIPFKIIKLLSH